MYNDEVRRLGQSPQEAIPKGTIAMRFTAHCERDASGVLIRCKEVLNIVFQQNSESWPSIDTWRSLLPEWFILRSSEEIPQKEAERRLRLPLEERIKLSQRWSVSAFVHWFQPGERYWYWWGAEIKDTNTIIITVIATDDPFPWGSLDWLLRASGAISITPM